MLGDFPAIPPNAKVVALASAQHKLGFNGTWSMAVGGMIGGGIFSTLGVVVSIAGPWAWLSFLVAGLIALAAGYSYARLAVHYGEGGGAFTYLNRVGAHNLAGSLVWVLTAGYVLTNAVYAYTFGQYLGHVADLGSWFPRAISVAVMAAFIGLNLRSVSEAGGVEIFLVWAKLLVLVGLATWGLARWDPPMLSRGVPDAGLLAAIFGAVSVFMAYEGFQLISYDYDDIESVDRTLPRAMLWAIAVVILVYMLVAIGTTMLIGADRVVEHEEVALAYAGREALGLAGLVIVTIAAAFSTGSAINATLFATARLTHQVTRGGQFPAFFDHRNNVGVPDRAVVALGAAAALLAALGNLTALVEAASLAFLVTFAVVCALAFRESAGHRAITGFGALSAGAAAIALVKELVDTAPIALALLAALALIAIFLRPWLLKHVRTLQPDKNNDTPGSRD